MNTGCMPRTDFYFEEFEGLLGSFYLTLLPLRNSMVEKERQAFELASTILAGFAERHGVQPPIQAVDQPRAATDWGKPKLIESVSSLFDLSNSFWRDFGVAQEQGTIDRTEWLKFVYLLLEVAHGRRLLVAAFTVVDGVTTSGKIVTRGSGYFTSEPNGPFGT